MSASYPTSVKSFVTRNAGDTIQPAHVNDLQDEVNAIESGLLTGTAPVSASNASFVHLSVTGDSTLASSTLKIGTVPYIFPSSGAPIGQVLTCVSTSGSTMGLEWREGPLKLLKSNNGTDASAGAATVDSFTISGLTANDSLEVLYTLESSSQATAGVFLTNATDSVNLISLVGGNTLGANTAVQGRAMLRQRQNVSTTFAATADGQILGGARSDTSASVSVTTAWTANWALALRHGGVTAGGTMKFGWSVYKKAGQ